MGRRTTHEDEIALELRYAKAALAELHIVPDGVIERYEDDGRPDFRFQLAGRTIALEVVRAIDEPLARGRGATEQLKAATAKQLTAAGVNAIVSFQINDAVAAALHEREERTDLIEAHAAVMTELAREASREGVRVRRFSQRPSRSLKNQTSGIDGG